MLDLSRSIPFGSPPTVDDVLYIMESREAELDRLAHISTQTVSLVDTTVNRTFWDRRPAFTPEGGERARFEELLERVVASPCRKPLLRILPDRYEGFWVGELETGLEAEIKVYQGYAELILEYRYTRTRRGRSKRTNVSRWYRDEDRALELYLVELARRRGFGPMMLTMGADESTLPPSVVEGLARPLDQPPSA